jgi:hypothetical protein
MWLTPRPPRTPFTMSFNRDGGLGGHREFSCQSPTPSGAASSASATRGADSAAMDLPGHDQDRPRPLARVGSGVGAVRSEDGDVSTLCHDPRVPGSLSTIRAILPDPRQPNRYPGSARRRRTQSTRHRLGDVRALHGARPANDVVHAVLADSSGRLWLSTNKGLSRFDPSTRQFRNYDVNDGLQSNEFNPALRSRAGAVRCSSGALRLQLLPAVPSGITRTSLR